jgi:hypothetical protein
MGGRARCIGAPAGCCRVQAPLHPLPPPPTHTPTSPNERAAGAPTCSTTPAASTRSHTSVCTFQRHSALVASPPPLPSPPPCASPPPTYPSPSLSPSPAYGARGSMRSPAWSRGRYPAHPDHVLPTSWDSFRLARGWRTTPPRPSSTLLSSLLSGPATPAPARRPGPAPAAPAPPPAAPPAGSNSGGTFPQPLNPPPPPYSERPLRPQAAMGAGAATCTACPGPRPRSKPHTCTHAHERAALPPNTTHSRAHTHLH